MKCPKPVLLHNSTLPSSQLLATSPTISSLGSVSTFTGSSNNLLILTSTQTVTSSVTSPRRPCPSPSGRSPPTAPAAAACSTSSAWWGCQPGARPTSAPSWPGTAAPWTLATPGSHDPSGLYYRNHPGHQHQHLSFVHLIHHSRHSYVTMPYHHVMPGTCAGAASTRRSSTWASTGARPPQPTGEEVLLKYQG